MNKMIKASVIKRKFSTFLRNPHLVFHYIYHPVDRLTAYLAVIRSTKKYKREGELFGPYRIDHLPFELQNQFYKHFILNVPRMIHERRVGDGTTFTSKQQVPELCQKHMPYVNFSYGSNWPKAMIDELIAATHARQDFSCGEYPGSVLQYYQTLDKVDVSGKKAVVLGSISPWIECILLGFGVKESVTVEYGPISCDHDKIKTIDRLKETLPLSGSYDLVCSFSSIEHGGLGRYGDQIDPEGDLRAMNEIYEWLIPGGLALIGVPVSDRNILIGNGHRIYSLNYLEQHLFKGFEIIDSIPFPFGAEKIDYSGHDGQNQPLYVLKKPNN